MKYKILLKSFLTLALIVSFSSQVYASSEVTGTLSSVATQGGSEVSGTLSNVTIVDNNTISGNVVGGQSSGSSGGSSGGSVLGAGTGGGFGNFGEVLGETNTPGFPATGLLPKDNSIAIKYVVLALSATLMMYAYYRTKKNNA